MNSEPSGGLYSAITGHWPRITTGLVVVLGIVEWIAGGLTADSGLELYLITWAGATGGLWFLFEKAERAVSDQVRSQMASWLGGKGLREGLESIPEQFATLFDRLFGERHFSGQCFAFAAMASVGSAFVVAAAYAASMTGEILAAVQAWEAEEISWWFFISPVILGYALSLVYNVVPDYLSLLETRWAIGRMRRGNVLTWLIADLVLTASLSAAAVTIVATIAGVGYQPLSVFLLDMVTFQGTTLNALEGLPVDFNLLSVFFYSAFATSVWLWLYAGGIALSRTLLRMNSGVGFLLRVTDVERQPFRSMGFVSVIIVSVLFALGLPLVLV